MKRLCVFCGSLPTLKNKEHVLPRWLLRLTGEPGRIAHFGVRYFTDESRRFAFDRFTFPSCSSCNASYSGLEQNAKRIIERIFKVQKISADDIVVLLDWLDKVRIGLWLGIMSLNNNAFGIEPKFFISRRVGSADRMLSIFLEGHKSKGLLFTGPMYPSFMFLPSCFALRINNLYLFNASCPFMISKNSGFPYPVSLLEERADRKYVMEFETGTQEIVKPLLESRTARGSLTVYQPMFVEALQEMRKSYETQFVRCHARDWDQGQGPLIADMKGGIRILGNEDVVLPMLASALAHWKRLAIQVPRTQNHLSTMIPNKPNDESALEIWEQNRELNELMISKFKEQSQSPWQAMN